MNPQFYHFRILLVSLFLICSATSLGADYVTFSSSVKNASSGGDGSTVVSAQTLEYTITITNISGAPITNARLYNRTIIGTRYNPNHTTVNGVTVPSQGSVNPFDVQEGLLLGSGTIASGASVIVTIQFMILNNIGIVYDDFVFKGTKSTGLTSHINFVQTGRAGPTNCILFANDLFQSATTSSVPVGNAASKYPVIHSLDPTSGAVVGKYYGGGGLCYDAISGTGLTNGSLLKSASAIAYEQYTNRIYFVNDDLNSHLGYVDLAVNPVCARTYSDDSYILEPGATSANKRIDKMTFVNGNTTIYRQLIGYALTADQQDLIQFNIGDGTTPPTIYHLGSLVNAPLNGTHDVLAETDGDIFGSCYGSLYFLPNSGNLYQIDIPSLQATYIGTITNLPAIRQINAAGFDVNGDLYLGGQVSATATSTAYGRIYKVDLATLNATSIINTNSGTYRTGDYGSGNFPAIGAVINATQSYRDINNPTLIVAGSPIEFTIEITNNGNINATGVSLINPIPATAHYIAGSTTVNGVAIADVNGAMPFATEAYINAGTDLAGILKPGDANKAVIKFSVTTDAYSTTCNQPVVHYTKPGGDLGIVRADAAAVNGVQQDACFFSDYLACGCPPRLSGSLNADNTSLLQWSVEKEDSIAYYELEYGLDNNKFRSLYKINVGEGMDSLYHYHLTDNNITTFGPRNYRLKAVKTDGRTALSNTVNLYLKGTAQIQPNPFSNDLYLQVELAKAETVQVKLVDLNGKIVYTVVNKLHAGTNNLHLEVPSALSSGIYFAEVVAGNSRILQKKLIKL